MDSNQNNETMNKNIFDEVKSDEVKSDEVKTDEVKSDEVKKDKIMSKYDIQQIIKKYYIEVMDSLIFNMKYSNIKFRTVLDENYMFILVVEITIASEIISIGFKINFNQDNNSINSIKVSESPIYYRIMGTDKNDKNIVKSFDINQCDINSKYHYSSITHEINDKIKSINHKNNTSSISFNNFAKVFKNIISDYRFSYKRTKSNIIYTIINKN